ncbi:MULTISPECIES: tyrosine-type recombinase/integrase [Bifidobacterium]|uniref:Integrase n=2 Tax=Bifidobacterium TaxID=1678 RepID=A0A261FNN9_9BIFI|nr:MULTISPECIES: tyrosine-type recombinase/integrase [Bifidobacterium]OZG60708.1 integrase [Bifidobacterium lemurum]OZG69606.1 integrase [Bifidobacterium eulemuris]QOL32277.1 tyrosine-type recombinase/integrase [Bifidobacterium eulemuris]QOL35237.1 tyrosine-type recombinase/integrase [Bifidobacterium lemurum]
MEFPTHRQPPEEWVDWLDGWVKDLRAQGATERTIENWWYLVSHFGISSGVAPGDASSKDLIVWLSRGVTAAAMRSDWSAAASFFRWAQKTQLRTDDPMASVPMAKREKRIQRPAPDEAVRKGLQSSNPRVRLIVSLFVDAGLRRSEVCLTHTRDVVDDLLGKSLIVHGKGNKDRIVPLSSDLTRQIENIPPGWFFPGEAGGHICPDTVYRLTVSATGCTPHAFRRKFATDMWKATRDVVQIKELLGHESLTTTQQYIFSTADDLRDAVTQLHEFRQRQAIQYSFAQF